MKNPLAAAAELGNVTERIDTFGNELIAIRQELEAVRVILQAQLDLTTLQYTRKQAKR